LVKEKRGPPAVMCYLRDVISANNYDAVYNKAFERYFIMESDDLRSIYKDTAKVIKIDKLKLEEN
jgi:hypothetical protein